MAGGSLPPSPWVAKPEAGARYYEDVSRGNQRPSSDILSFLARADFPDFTFHLRCGLGGQLIGKARVLPASSQWFEQDQIPLD